MADDVVQHPGRREQQAPRERERAALRAGAPARALVAHRDGLRRDADARAPGARSRRRPQRAPSCGTSARAPARRSRRRARAARAHRRSSRRSRAWQSRCAAGRARRACQATPGWRQAERSRLLARERALEPRREGRERAVDRLRSGARRHDELGPDARKEHEPEAARTRRAPQPYLHRSAAQEHRALALHARQTMRRARGADHGAPGAARRRPVLARPHAASWPGSTCSPGASSRRRSQAGRRA